MPDEFVFPVLIFDNENDNDRSLDNADLTKQIKLIPKCGSLPLAITETQSQYVQERPDINDL
jgi:hypothetical protein